MSELKTKVAEPKVGKDENASIPYRVKGVMVEATSVGEAVKKVKKSNPDLFAQDNPDGDDKKEGEGDH